MASPPVESGSRVLASEDVTEDHSRRIETESSWRSLVTTPPVSDERRAPRDGFIKHYELIRQLGEGGMGIVLLARDTKLGRLVAIKLLQDRGQVTERLLAEAQATARCRHESIVTVHDVDELDGNPYMVLEYLDGRTLRDVLSAGPGKSRALPKGLALDIVLAVTRALTAAHEHDIVHRDRFQKRMFRLQNGANHRQRRRLDHADSHCPRHGL